MLPHINQIHPDDDATIQHWQADEMDGSDCLPTLYIPKSGSTCLADGPPTKTRDLGMANHLNLLDDCEAIIAGFHFDHLFQKVMNVMVMNWPYIMLLDSIVIL